MTCIVTLGVTEDKEIVEVHYWAWGREDEATEETCGWG